MTEVLERLWDLQKAMSELGEKERQLRDKPEPFATTDREFNASTAAIDELKGNREELDGRRREIERTLSAEQETLKKFESQLMQVKNQMQYSAAWKEIDTARKKVKELEDELLGVMGQIETIDTELAERETALAPLREKHDAEFNEWQGSLSGIKEMAESVRQKIGEIEKNIPDRLRQEFHKIFSHRQGIAVALVENNACSACRVKVRPAIAQSVRRGEITMCDSCRRIMYVEKAS